MQQQQWDGAICNGGGGGMLACMASSRVLSRPCSAVAALLHRALKVRESLVRSGRIGMCRVGGQHCWVGKQQQAATPTAAAAMHLRHAPGAFKHSAAGHPSVVGWEQTGSSCGSRHNSRVHQAEATQSSVQLTWVQAGWQLLTVARDAIWEEQIWHTRCQQRGGGVRGG
jgi:hypothetical protein